MYRQHKTGGYVGLIVLLITVCIIAAAMAFTLRSTFIEPAETLSPASGSNPENTIQAAENAKKLLEGHQRIELGQ